MLLSAVVLFVGCGGSVSVCGGQDKGSQKHLLQNRARQLKLAPMLCRALRVSTVRSEWRSSEFTDCTSGILAC